MLVRDFWEKTIRIRNTKAQTIIIFTGETGERLTLFSSLGACLGRSQKFCWDWGSQSLQGSSACSHLWPMSGCHPSAKWHGLRSESLKAANAHLSWAYLPTSQTGIKCSFGSKKVYGYSNTWAILTQEKINLEITKCGEVALSKTVDPKLGHHRCFLYWLNCHF